jgi:hypothetical protein
VGRSIVFAEQLDRKVFRGMTFGELMAGARALNCS